MNGGNPGVAHLIRLFIAPTETFIQYQMRNLKSYRPFVVSHGPRDGVQVQTDLDVTYAAAGLKGPQRLVADLSYRVGRRLGARERALMAKVIKDKNAALVHCHYAVDARYYLKLIGELGLPSVVSLYGYDVSCFPRSYLGLGVRYLAPIFESVDLFLAMSEDMKKDVIGLGCAEEKVIVHYYGVETERFIFPDRRYEDKEELNILMCGTLEVKKAQHLVLKALHRIAERGTCRRKFRVTLIGNGPMRAALTAQVEGYGWQDRVKFYGHIPYSSDRLIEAYRDADIFALPSITVRGDKEGIPGTIVEAMASGLPVVSSYHAGIPEILTDGVDGVLVKEKDEQELARVFTALIDDRYLRERLGKAAALKAASELNARNRIAELERIYDRLRAGRR